MWWKTQLKSNPSIHSLIKWCKYFKMALDDTSDNFYHPLHNEEKSICKKAKEIKQYFISRWILQILIQQNFKIAFSDVIVSLYTIKHNRYFDKLLKRAKIGTYSCKDVKFLQFSFRLYLTIIKQNQ